MCESHTGWEHTGAYVAGTARGLAPSRRSVLRAGLLTGAAIGVSGLLPAAAWAGKSKGPRAQVPLGFGLDGAGGYRTAQHIHARGSEGPASMSAQASEAAKWVDALWFTDHDWREAGIGAPSVVHFNSLTNEALPPNPPWRWVRRDGGSLASAAGGIETVDVSADDPDPSGALYARAVSATTAPASAVWFADDAVSRNSMRTPIWGQTWDIDVLLREGSQDGWAFLRVELSYHPASGGRPDAYYFLEYRFGPGPERTYTIEQIASADLGDLGDSGDAGSVTLRPNEQALVGVVTVPQDVGQYVTQQLSFVDDVAVLFPDMIARDNSVRCVWLGATSRNGAPANACFDYLRMNRVYGQAQFDDRRTIADEIAPLHPNLGIFNGTEVSYGGSHRHWLGGDIALPTYNGTLKARGAWTPPNTEVVSTILAAGGMPIANHPFGTNAPKRTDAAAAASARDYVATLLANQAEGGLQGIEIFYRIRAGATLEHHWLLYRLAVRNGLVLTATGVSDNHWGRTGSWNEERNHFFTGIFADDRTESGLIDAQRRGRAFSAEIASFYGQLDLGLDEDVMGQIGVRPERVSRTLTIQATQLPKDSYVEVWQVPVDLGGLDSEPGGVVARVPATSFAQSTASLAVDTTRDSAFAAMVVLSNGRRVAGTNPVWHLTGEPTTWSIPDERRAE